MKGNRQAAVLHVPPTAVQSAASFRRQMPPATQHAPGGSQGFGSQEVWAQLQVWAVKPQLSCARAMHVPVKMLQQTPRVGCGQGEEAQTADGIDIHPKPPPPSVPPTRWQVAIVRRTHAPVWMLQQATTGGHAAGEQVTPAVQMCELAPQEVCQVNVHSAVTKLQQRPYGRQAVGVHAP